AGETACVPPSGIVEDRAGRKRVRRVMAVQGLHLPYRGRPTGHPITNSADERVSRPRYERWARPALPPVEEAAGEDIYRLRHWHKARLDEPGDIPRVAIEECMGHELPGVEGAYSEVTLAMEERIVGYLQRV